MLDGDYINHVTLVNKLDQIDANLKKYHSQRNWKDIIELLTDNALATIALASCINPRSGACFFSVTMKLVSVSDIVGGLHSDAIKDKSVTDARNDIAFIKKTIRGGRSTSGKIKQRLIMEFNQLCSEIEEKCIR